jgi:hypothetical protein
MCILTMFVLCGVIKMSKHPWIPADIVSPHRRKSHKTGHSSQPTIFTGSSAGWFRGVSLYMYVVCAYVNIHVIFIIIPTVRSHPTVLLVSSLFRPFGENKLNCYLQKLTVRYIWWEENANTKVIVWIRIWRSKIQWYMILFTNTKWRILPSVAI